MRVTTLVLALAIASAFSFTVLAQSPGSPATGDNSRHCMQGMEMPGCPQTDKNTRKAPGMQH